MRDIRDHSISSLEAVNECGVVRIMALLCVRRACLIKALSNFSGSSLRRISARHTSSYSVP